MIRIRLGSEYISAPLLCRNYMYRIKKNYLAKTATQAILHAQRTKGLIYEK